MALRDIITVGDPRLRKRSHPVEKVTPEVRELIRDMVETMDAANGVGLAAVQVGEMVRVIVIETPEDEEDPTSGKLYIVINPEIVKMSKETAVGSEGCLSVPGYAGEVERATEVVVRGLDRHGKPFRLRARGFLARVFQHEIDHCNGVLYTDRLVAPDRIWEVKPGEEEQVEVEAARRRTAALVG
ncbi:MAG TPA: peptide deformylase [Anaerolineae bacterium]|nr:peptide deformylase [Anaerolineae bacterium]HQH37134.1 peptide deformylase [Anaerolineae bacterium]